MGAAPFWRAPGHMGGDHVAGRSTDCALAPLSGLAPGHRACG
jgi:hypothetical protein